MINKLKLWRIYGFGCLWVLIGTSCQKDEIPLFTLTSDSGELTEMNDAYHLEERMRPYPCSDNELLLNPPAFTVPTDPERMRKPIQFEVASTPDFSDEATLRSDWRPWNLFNPHCILETGRWYWRYRYQDTPENWSETMEFEVKEETPRFVTPAFRTFFNRAPSNHPRLYCYLDATIDRARKSIETHAEYKNLIYRADGAIRTLTEKYGTQPIMKRDCENLRDFFEYIYHAYYLTLRDDYKETLLTLLDQILAGFNEKELSGSDFQTSGQMFCLAELYDTFYDELSSEQKSKLENALYKGLANYFYSKSGNIENRLYDNHFWQINVRAMFQLAFLLYDKPDYAEKVCPMLEYCYELWTGRAPAWGVNMDGSWQNGASYFGVNIITLCYFPALLSHITGTDFLKHPWYRNAGKAMLYGWPTGSTNIGFGDGTELSGDVPGPIRTAFLDFLARETGDVYASWFVGKNRDKLVQDKRLRLYRMASDAYQASSSLPSALPKMMWMQGSGEVTMHSSLLEPDKNISLCFWSSMFGSGSHTSASQNAFNLFYHGSPVFRSSGYYDAYSSLHNVLSYRHTRAHNTILVNGIGQPFCTKGYGIVLRALGGDHITYCLGDASHAYGGISDDPKWIGVFENLGISQTPEYGFGATPLSRYKRHVAMLHPNIVLLYDELEATEPVRWDWLLHSPTPFDIDAAKGEVCIENAEKGFKSKVCFYSSTPLSMSQTDKFMADPGKKGNYDFANQWHLTASADNRQALRLLTVICLNAPDETPAGIEVAGDGKFVIGDWTVDAVLDTGRPAALRVTHAHEPVVLDYGSENLSLGGMLYMRKYLKSTLLYDATEGAYGVEEQKDRQPASTRTQ